MASGTGSSQTPGCGSRPSILCLPPAIRLRIYDHLGMRGSTSSQVRDGAKEACVFDLNGKRHLLPWPRRRLDFHGLLISCRLLYDEASRLLYSTNHFTIRYSDCETLNALRNLRADTVVTLRHLRVFLVEASCHIFADTGWGFGSKCCTEAAVGKMAGSPTRWCINNHSHDKPLGVGGVDLDSRTRQLLSEWDSAAGYLGQSVLDDTLELALVCDVLPTNDGVAVARSVMSSLLRLPTTKGCSVWFWKERDPRLQQLAEDAVLYSRRIKPRTPSPAVPDQPVSKPVSLLLSLPREVHHQILEYTDLVTPWTQVTWSPDHNLRGFIAGRWHCEDLEFRGQSCPPSRHHGCQFNQCCETWPSISRGCYCRLQHSAFSSTPPSACNCWEPPLALFLICRALYQDAQAVFFSRNRFIVHDRSSDLRFTHGMPGHSGWLVNDQDRYAGSQFGASTFLRDVVPEACLGHLRFLELVFPPYEPDHWPTEAHPAMEDWVETVEWARTRLNIGGLTIRLVMADQSEWEPLWTRKHMSKNQGTRIIEAYWMILSPLVRLRELRSFYACFVSPWRWSEDIDLQGGPRTARAKERELKKLAERCILGNERYELQCSSEEEPEESLWNLKLIRDV